MILSLPDDYPRWYEKMHALATETEVEFALISVSFEIAEEYLHSEKKDLEYWRGQVYETYGEKIMTVFYNGQNLLESSKTAELRTPDLIPIDIARIQEGLKEQLSKFQGKDEFESWIYAYAQAHEQIVRFILKKAKHPLDYVLEDLKEDIETFYKTQLFFKMMEGRN